MVLYSGTIKVLYDVLLTSFYTEYGKMISVTFFFSSNLICIANNEHLLSFMHSFIQDFGLVGGGEVFT